MVASRSIHSVCIVLIAIAPQVKNFNDFIREFAYIQSCTPLFLPHVDGSVTVMTL